MPNSNVKGDKQMSNRPENWGGHRGRTATAVHGAARVNGR
jgi:hypothetical protein